MAQLIRCRAIKPFVLFGRVVITNERLFLHPDDFDELSRAGCVERAELGVLVRPAGDRWTTPVTR